MNATIGIELELLEPVLLANAEDLQQLHPSQVKWVGIRITPSSEAEEDESVTFRTDNTRLAIRNLFALTERAQPAGTSVLVWYQGHSETLTISGGPIHDGR